MRAFFATLLLFAYYVTCAQQDPAGRGDHNTDRTVDTRVDNMRYWMQKASMGLVPYNPDIVPEPPVAKGSLIAAKGVKTTNSPDIPVTSAGSVTESENSVFVDPSNANHLLNSNNSTSWTGNNAGTVFGASSFISQNSGIGWAGSAAGAGGTNNGDPAVAIGLNGRRYINYCSNPGGQWIAMSDDGNTWATATITGNPGDLADKNHMWIDNAVSSPYQGNLYAAWTDFGGADDTHIMISRSSNHGLGWSTPIRLSDAVNAVSHNQGVNIQTGPGGEVYACWSVYDNWPADEKAIGFSRSLNGGATFQPATRIIGNLKGIRYTGVAKNHRVNSFPVMAVDISGGAYNGNIYIVWTNNGVPGINSGTNRSVWLIRSSDGGNTWSAPVRVNQGPNLAGKEAYLPWISCDPETGVLSVVFYDDRNVAATQCEVFVAYSIDAGNNWTDFPVSDVAFTPAPIPGLAAGYMGDYLGITSKGGKVFPCWTDNRTGTFLTWVSPFELSLNAAFAASSTTPCCGAQVTFTDASSGSPTSWTWSFPGGIPAAYTGRIPPPVVYSTPGFYPVSLTVSDGTNSDAEVRQAFINVKVVKAGFSSGTVYTEVNKGVIFSDQSSCSPQTWNWSFPGGTPAACTGNTPPPVTYALPGSYDVSLTVIKNGVQDTKTEQGFITVTPVLFRIKNGIATTCSGDFCDSGGLIESYMNNEIFTETIYPSESGTVLRASFTLFAVEEVFDTLAIYDGPDTTSPLIGYFHGPYSPGVITATGPTGALTFRFISDFMISGPGWQAELSCLSAGTPMNRTIDNVLVTGNLCFDAFQEIITAGNGTYFRVQPGSSATLIAGEKISLRPGTSIFPGGSLHAFVAPAGPFCNSSGPGTTPEGTENTPLLPQSTSCRVYPNPTAGEFIVDLGGYVPGEPAVVTIYNMKGEVIITRKFTNLARPAFSLAGQPPGIFLVRVNAGNGYGMARIAHERP